MKSSSPPSPVSATFPSADTASNAQLVGKSDESPNGTPIVSTSATRSAAGVADASTVRCVVPSAPAISAACGLSSYRALGIRTHTVVSAEASSPPRTSSRVAASATHDESIPPLSRHATGTSACSRRPTLASSSRAVFRALGPLPITAPFRHGIAANATALG